MQRKALHIETSEDGSRAIYIDSKNSSRIFEFITSKPVLTKKFKYVIRLILGGHRNTDLYDKEEINENCKGVTAIKLMKGKLNPRIYCKEITTENKVRVVVCCELLEKKKSQKISHKEINLINKVAKYEYEIR